MPVPPGGYVVTAPASGTQALWAPGPGNLTPIILTPKAQAPADVAFRSAAAYAKETVETGQEARALYLDRLACAWTRATVCFRTVTAATNLEHGEIAICTGTPSVRTGAKLTRRGYVDAVATFEGVAGVQTVTVTLSGLTAGDHLWVAWVQKAGQGGTLATFDPCVADHNQSGCAQYKAATQLSTMVAGTQFGLLGDSVEPLWCVVEVWNA